MRAGGVLGAEVAAIAGEQISFTPVEHLYIFGPARPSPASPRLPFVKWRQERPSMREHRFAVDRRLNGVFAMTADNLPLVGAATTVEWTGEALWTTHAGGAAGVLVDLITGRPSAVERLETWAGAASPARMPTSSPRVRSRSTARSGCR